MTVHLGTVRPGQTIYIPFNTYDSNDPSASVAVAALVAGDIEVYKDGAATTRASDSGYALLDTDGIDFDSHVGIGGFSIDLADNSTAGFWAAGSRYFVVCGPVTVDAAVINFIAATFDIGYPDAILNTTIATLASATSFTLTKGPAEANALIGFPCLTHDVASEVQLAIGYVSAYDVTTKTVTLAADPGVFTAAATDNVAFFMPANVRAFGGTLQTAGDVGADTAAILVDTSTTLQGELDGIQADTEDIQTRLPAALVNSRMDATIDAAGFEQGAIDNIWDEPLTGSSHNVATSSGRRLRQVEEAFVFATGTIATVTDGHTFTLDTGAVANADYYIRARLQIEEGTGAGQSRIIVAYTVGRVVTLDSDFDVNPDTSSLYSIVASDVHVSVSDADLAEGFVATYTNTTTITLDSAAVGTTNYYVGELIVFTHGTGAGQAREITAYTSGRVVTMSPALVTALDTTTTWHIMAMVSVPEIVDEMWDEDATGHQTTGTFGQAIGDPGANTETMYDAVVTDATGTNVAADVVAMKAETVLILADTADMQPKLGTPATDVSADIAAVKVDTAATLVDTAEIGTAGAGLLDLGGMSTGMKGEVNAEADTALTDYDPPTKAEMDTAHALLATPAQVNTEVDNALNTAIPGTPTANSVNERLVAVDDLTQSGGGGDLAAILADTNELQADDTPTSIAAVQTTVDAIETDTQDIQSRLPAALVNSRMDATVDGTGMETGAIDAIFQRQMTESYNTDGTSPTMEQSLTVIMQMLTEFAISGTTLTVKGLDGSTSKMTFTLDDATNPTSLTRAT